MAESNSNDNSPPRKRGFFGKQLDLISKVIVVLIFSIILSVVIEWIGMMFFYPDAGYSHAESMMKTEIGYLSSATIGDNSNQEAVSTASTMVSEIVNFVFIDSGILDKLNRLRETSLTDNKFQQLVSGLVNEYYNYLMAAVFVIIMFLIRLSILILSIPAFILFGVVGVSDGLMQRDLRRWCGGNKSGFIYHWAKKFALPVLLVSWFIYLSVPTSIHPNLIITPCAVLFGLVLMVMASKFKKYL